MRSFCKLSFWFLLSTLVVLNVESDKVRNKISQPGEKTANSFTDVVNHAYCDSSLAETDKFSKKTLEEVHTYAELKYDPRSSLPDSFTICSTIMTTSCQGASSFTFFNILDNDRTQFLAPICNPGTIVSFLKIFLLQRSSKVAIGKIPPMFPNQWTKSCLAVNTTSGLIHWVVEGTLILKTISEGVKNSKSRPTDLGKKLVLGARSYGGVWFASSHKVTNCETQPPASIG